MLIHKDKVKRIWYVSCYYENWKGETEHKMKRGVLERFKEIFLLNIIIAY